MTSASQKTVFVLHTSFSLVDVLGKRLSDLDPGMRIVNIADDSLLPDVRSAGHLTSSVARRLVGYAVLAESAGADVIFNTCSSVGEAADLMRQVVDIPVVKIDERMAEEAVSYGSQVAVVATLPTTLDPTIRLIQYKAQESEREVEIRCYLVEGALDVLMSRDAERHDAMILDEVESAAQQADVIVLAQASMARLVPKLEGKLAVPILTSLASGIEKLKSALEG